jgi:membrane protein
MWFGGTLLFGWSLNRFADYGIIYGSLGVGVALLVWMFLISFVVLVGAEFNALLFPRTVERRLSPVRMPTRKAVAG